MSEQSNCGFIVPYRDRAAHLQQFVPHMRQRFPHSPIFIIEQTGSQPFNRAKLLNIGFLQFNNYFDYFAAHDIDMLPMQADYSYPNCPTHLATRVQQFGYKMPYPQYFGGVTLFNNKDFYYLDGFANTFWGWGGEDDDMYKQCERKGVAIERRQCTFKSLLHNHKINFELHRRNCDKVITGRSEQDGLTACKFNVIACEYYTSYIHLKAQL